MERGALTREWEKGLSSICLVISVLAASLTLLVGYIILSLIKFTDFENNSTLLVFWYLQTASMSITPISLVCGCCVFGEGGTLSEDVATPARCIIYLVAIPYIWTTLILFSGLDPSGFIFLFEIAWWVWSIAGGIAIAIGARYLCVPAVLEVMADYVSSQAQVEQATLISPTTNTQPPMINTFSSKHFNFERALETTYDSDDEQEKQPINEKATPISPINEENLLDRDDSPV
jgi:hypothetical protein